MQLRREKNVVRIKINKKINIFSKFERKTRFCGDFQWNLQVKSGFNVSWVLVKEENKAAVIRIGIYIDS